MHTLNNTKQQFLSTLDYKEHWEAVIEHQLRSSTSSSSMVSVHERSPEAPAWSETNSDGVCKLATRSPIARMVVARSTSLKGLAWTGDGRNSEMAIPLHSTWACLWLRWTTVTLGLLLSFERLLKFLATLVWTVAGDRPDKAFCLVTK